MNVKSIPVEAVFDGTVLRPVQTLPLSPQQRVLVTVQVTAAESSWPENVAAIYAEINAEDRRLAEALFPTVRETWPSSEKEP